MTREEIQAIKDHTRAIEMFCQVIGKTPKARGKSKKEAYKQKFKRIIAGIEKA